MPAIGVQYAPDDGPLVVNPSWVDMGLYPGVFVEGFSIDRGRLTEFDRTGTGTAQVRFHDRLGHLDPTNASGTLFGRINPMRQFSIVLTNPNNSTPGTVFRGFVERWEVDTDLTEDFAKVTVDLVDAGDLFSAYLLRPNNAGDATNDQGDVIYLATANPQVRIQAILDDVGWPAALAEIFTGNVSLQGGTYAPNTQAAAAIQDAVDADFPGAAQFWVNRQGTATFHGRQARFRPDVAEYRISQWNVGDVAAFAGDNTTAVASRLLFSRDKNFVVNSALSTPHNVGTSTASNLYEDSSSIGTYGYRTWSAEDLLTGGGIASNVGDALAETSTFATYYGQNMKQATNRIQQVRLTSPPPAHPTSDRVWRVLSQVEINDIFTVTTTRPTFSAEDYFVEGIHYEASAFSTSYHYVELTCDVSPRANYATSTFGTTATL